MKASDFNPEYQRQIGIQLNEQRKSPLAARLPDAQPKPHPRQALERSPSGEGSRGPRLEVCIERRARRLLDADNFAGGCKPIIDQMRYAQLIPDDDPASIELVFRQAKVATRKEEGTLITIEELP